MSVTLHPALFEFLKVIREENSRKYFASIRPLYDDILANFQEFIGALAQELSQFDPELEGINVKKCIFRIYRDARMLKEGDYLYKYNRGAVIAPEGRQSRKARLYIHLTPSRSIVGGGVWRCDSSDLYKIRTYLTHHADEYHEIIEDPTFKSLFRKVRGKKLKRLPQGFKDQNEFPELFKQQQFLIKGHYNNKKVLSDKFFEQVIQNYITAKPFFDFINKALEDS